VEKIKEFKLNPSKGPVQNEEIIPPPSFTDKIIPFNWGYHQNPTIKLMTDSTTGEITLVNMSASNRLMTQYIRHDIATVPSAPPLPPPDDPIITSLIVELRKALEERPIWTRRALQNRISDVPGMYLMKPAIQYVGYQFRGGPWRDSIIKWGVDPRTDPKYRFYQTMFFKIYNRPDERQPGDPWHDVRSEYTRTANRETLSRESHIFDGKSISLDGKVWQVCDITDPLIKFVASTKKVRETCDIDSDGWFCNGTWAKMKGIMKTKIAGIRVGREIMDEEFAPALAFPDIVELSSTRKKLTVPLPDWRLDINDVNEMIKRGIKTSITDSGLRKRRVKGRAYRKHINGKRAGKPLWRTGPKRKIPAQDASTGKAGGEEADAFPVDPRLLDTTESPEGPIQLEEIEKDQMSNDEVDTSTDEVDESGEEDNDGISDIVDEDADADVSDEDEDDEDEEEDENENENEYPSMDEVDYIY
jgi:general transcription factor 3C polypeptide 5 (transcription factor C subunit 1)